MDILFNILENEDGSFVIKGVNTENQDLMIFQDFNPFTHEKFDSIDSCKTYIKENYAFDSTYDTEGDNYLLIKDKTTNNINPEETIN